MSALWLCIACALLLSGCDARRHRRRKAQVANVARHDVQRSSERIIPFLQQGDALDVCECEDASLSAHGGLQCEREGWFIYSFEAVGRWVNGGGSVPLSRAKCCRLCLPEHISPEISALMPAGATGTAIISVGCHASTTKSQVACETSPATTFVSGFQHAVLVPSLASATFFPEGPVTCCAPVLMLSTGDAWEIERCDCKWSSGPGCDGIGKDSLLWGYPTFRDGGKSRHVPVAPAQCCRACLGKRVHALNECRTLNHCSRRGVCVMGACECNAGWGGPDCTHAMRHSSWPPLWLTYVVMLVCLVLSLAALLAARHMLQDFIDRRRQAAEEQSALLDPLIVAEGEIGNEDTDDDNSDEERTIQLTETLTRWDVDSQPASPAAAQQPGSPGAARSAGEAAEAPEVHKPPRSTPQGEGGDADGEGSEVDPEEAALQAELAEKFDEKRSPLAHVRCTICCDRPVQVALVPCGHSNLCRKCARRMEQCPYCRKPVVRRQRLYLTADP